jgi:hypothetical protein
MDSAFTSQQCGLCVVYVITFCSGSLRQWCSMRCLCLHSPVRITLVSVLVCLGSGAQCVVYVITIHSGVASVLPMLMFN